MPPFFRKPYKSEATLFLEALKAQRPALEAEQRAGRALLWDKPIDRAAQADYKATKVPQQPYVYHSKSR